MQTIFFNPLPSRSVCKSPCIGSRIASVASDGVFDRGKACESPLRPVLTDRENGPQGKVSKIIPADSRVPGTPTRRIF